MFFYFILRITLHFLRLLQVCHDMNVHVDNNKLYSVEDFDYYGVLII